MALMVRGWASTSAIDLEDHSFDPDAIRWSSEVELLWHHRPDAPCGRIITLERRPRTGGPMALWCEAAVDPDYAKAPFTGFSVRTKIEKYQIHTIPRPHAVVTSAILLEVSLVPKPANHECIIQSREELPEASPVMAESINKARRLQRLLEQIR